jgi:ProQ/FINO family
MESFAGTGISPRVSARHRAAGDTAKSVRKLRWTGIASEAEALPDAISNNAIVAPRRHSTVIQTMPGYGPPVNRTAKIERNIAALVAAFPLAFATQPEKIKPLSIGIKQRIYGRCTLSNREIGDALRRYTCRVAYLHAIVEGAVRVDLDGTANGNVTAKEATHAAEQMKRILAIASGKPKDKIKPNAPAMPDVRPLPAMPDVRPLPAMPAVRPLPAMPNVRPLPAMPNVRLLPAMPNVRLLPAMPDAPSPGPRRLGLADLKQAGAARRIAREGVTPDV